MKEFFASPAAPLPPRSTEIERARMRRALAAAPPRARGSDDADALVSELRAVRSEVASLRDFLERLGQGAPANDEVVLTRKQTAAVLGVCIESISRLVRDGGLPCRRVGKEYRFLRSQVLAWLAARGESLSGGEH
jgi:excisionase family DNA binding protein